MGRRSLPSPLSHSWRPLPGLSLWGHSTKTCLGQGFILWRHHPKWCFSNFRVWWLGRWRVRTASGGPPRSRSARRAPPAGRRLPGSCHLLALPDTLLPAIHVAFTWQMRRRHSVSTLSFALGPSTSAQTNSETARPWPGKGLGTKSLAWNSGSPKAPLLASGGGLRCHLWCPSLDPWPLLFRGEGSSGPPELHPDLAQIPSTEAGAWRRGLSVSVVR